MVNSNRRPPLLWTPRHWPSWILCGLLRLTVLLPYPAILWLGRRLGGMLRVMVPFRRKVANTNLALCFPERDERQRRVLLKRIFESLGCSLLEMALCWWATDNKLAPLSRITGLENLHQALDAKKGVILLTGHFSAFEIAGRLLVRQLPMCVTYREFRNPVFHHCMVRARQRRFARAIHRYDTRALLQALQDNHIVWYAPDQDPGSKHSVFAPFFGIPAATLSTTSRLARITDAQVVPFSVRRLAANRGYELTIDPPLTDFPTGDPQADAITINLLLENRIRTMPDQYYWVHRRFKTRPGDGNGFYDPKPRRLKQQRRRRN